MKLLIFSLFSNFTTTKWTFLINEDGLDQTLTTESMIAVGNSWMI